MLDILTPEGALSFMIYRVSLIRKLSINFVNRDEGYFDYNGLSLRWIRVIKSISAMQSLIKKKTFCGFSMGRNQYWAGRVYDLCVYYMTGPPEGSTESGFMEKPGIEPATPGLQGIALIHYTTIKKSM